MQQNQAQISAGWWSKAANWVQKQYFNGTHLLDLSLNDQQSNEIWIMGMHFASNKAARRFYSTIVWFTYRDELHFQDVGWGCMLRVGQMSLAHALRIAKGSENYANQKQIINLIASFTEPKGVYSIENFVKKGKQIYGKQAGQWYTPCDVAFIIRDIQNKHRKQSQLKVIVFDSELGLESAIKILDVNNTADTSKSGFASIDKRKSREVVMKVKVSKIVPGLILILVRIGVNSCEQKYLASIVNILKHEPNCIGILGGRPGRAHFILGTTSTSFLYLDPHCVKQGKDINSYFSDKIFSLPHDKVDPSMALCFYVRDYIDLVMLHDRIDKTNLPFYMICETQTIVDIPQQLQ